MDWQWREGDFGSIGGHRVDLLSGERRERGCEGWLKTVAHSATPPHSLPVPLLSSGKLAFPPPSPPPHTPTCPLLPTKSAGSIPRRQKNNHIVSWLLKVWCWIHSKKAIMYWLLTNTESVWEWKRESTYKKTKFIWKIKSRWLNRRRAKWHSSREWLCRKTTWK